MPERKLLRQAVDGLVNRLWGKHHSSSAFGFEAAAASIVFVNAIGRLSPQNDVQRSSKASALQLVNDIAQIRLLLYAQSAGSVPT